MNTNFCTTIVTIPQYESTCWFNSILTCLLYSQYSRKLLLYEMNGFDKSNKLLMIINKILKSLYINDNDKASKYFKLIRPEVILSYVKNIYKGTMRYMITTGWFSNLFLYKFIENIGRSCIVLDYYNNNLYAGITQSFDITYDKFTNNFNFYFKYSIDNIKQKIIDIRTPDYLYVNIWNNRQKNDYEKIFNYYNKNNIKNKLLLRNYKSFTHSGLVDPNNNPLFNDIITFNGYDYKLDSCIIRNYNQYRSGYGHDIAGITCKNNKYVYNGWFKSTNDIGIDDTERKNIHNEPCKLIKYDWDIHTDDDRGVCIDLANCSLNNLKSQRQVKKTPFCFSFNLKKKKLVLIYVRIKSLNSGINYISIDKNASISATSISSQRSLNSIFTVSSASNPSPLKDDELYKGDEDDDSYDISQENKSRFEEKYNKKYNEKINKKYDEYNEKRGVIPDKTQRKIIKKEAIEKRRIEKKQH